MISNKSVSIIIPCLNEDKYIANCLESLIANDYDKELIDIIVIDGMSNDQTRNILAEFSNVYKFIRIIDNPDKIIPRALNIGIKNSKSDIILRADAHTIYRPNYISTLVSGLDKYKVDNIGGIRETALINDTNLSLAISIAISC